jgi:hypothetical protein
MATNTPIILKRFNGTDYDPLFPRTTGQQVFNSSLSLALLNGSNKINDSFLPDYVFGGMKFGGVIALSGTATTLQTIFGTWLNDSEAFGSIGKYFVVTTAGKLDTNFVQAVTNNVYRIADSNFSDEGQTGDPIDVEAGDWIVFTRTLLNTPSSGLFTFEFAIINNIYRLSTTSVDGLMSSTDKTKLDGIAASANNYVHPAYTTRSVDTSGVDVLDTFTSDAIGSVTGIATRTLPNATTGAAGVMSAADKTKLDGIATNANLYVLPVATASTLGGIEVGFTSTETNRAVVLSGNDAYVTLPRQIPAVTLNNGASDTPSFYAPTSSGIVANATTQSRQMLQSAGTNVSPIWQNAVRINYNDTEAASTSAGVFFGDILFEF